MSIRLWPGMSMPMMRAMMTVFGFSPDVVYAVHCCI
jgi:hypothetical protein